MLSDCVHGEDVLVTHRRGGSGLALESCQRCGIVGEVGAQQLDGDEAAERLIICLHHHAHTASPDAAENLKGAERGYMIIATGRGENALANQAVDRVVSPPDLAQRGQMASQLLGDIRILGENLRFIERIAAAPAIMHLGQNAANANFVRIKL